MNIGDNIQETTAGTSTLSIIVNGATANNRTFAAAVTAGAFLVGATNIPLRAEDDAGNWLTGAFTLTAPSGVYTLTRTAIGSSSAGGADVTLAGAVRKVSVVMTSSLARTFAASDSLATTTVLSLAATTVLIEENGVPKRITLANLMASIGVASGGLTVAGALTGTDVTTVTQAGIDVQTTLSALKTYFGATVSQVITVATPSAQATGTAFTVAGTYANGAPTALDYSTDGGNVWQAATAPAITGGAYSFSMTLSTANVSQVINVRDRANISTIGTSGSFAVTGAAVQALTVTTPSAKTSGVAFTVNGTYVNGTPTALDSSIDGGTSWQAVGTATIGGNAFSFSFTIASANASQTIKVRDRTTLVSATSGSFVVAVPTQTLTVTTPTAQTAGTAFTLAGTYANGTPTALAYSIDGGTTWTTAATPTISAGNYSFSAAVTAANASQVIKVRDATTLVVGTSAAFVVAATAVPAYLFSPVPYTSPVGGNISTNGYLGGNNAIYIKSAAGLTPPDVNFMWSKDPVTPPTAYAGTTPAKVTNNGDRVGCARTGGWTQGGATTQAYYGLYSSSGTLYAWGTPGTWYLWVITSDGFSKPFDNNTGTPIGYTFT